MIAPDCKLSPSVPYRGTTFPNVKLFSRKKKFHLLPSPIGELHFLITMLKLKVSYLTGLPSPIGELHFLINSGCITSHVYFLPSPIGELHFLIVRTCIFYECFKYSSVPYRGTTFPNIRNKRTNKYYIGSTSVPYRGTTFPNPIPYTPHYSYTPSILCVAN